MATDGDTVMGDGGVGDGGVDTVTRGLSMISFKSLVPGSEGVRVTDDTPPLIWVVDLVMVVKGCDRRHAARDLDAIPDTLFEVQKLVLKVLPGNGKWPVKLLTLKDAMDLIMVLPGPQAKLFRQQACDILTRVLAGDQTLHSQIDANATSTAPLHVLARAAAPPGIGQPVAKKTSVMMEPSDLTTRGNQICDMFDRYRNSNGGVVAPAIGQVYEGAMLAVFQGLDPRNGCGEFESVYKYVYCMQSQEHPDIVKIGRSQDVKARVVKINYERKDDPLIYRYSVRSLDSVRDEKLAHAEFAAFRVPVLTLWPLFSLLFAS
jgi:T5orf172 domain